MADNGANFNTVDVQLNCLALFDLTELFSKFQMFVETPLKQQIVGTTKMKECSKEILEFSVC